MLEYFVYCYGTEFIGLILCALFGCLGFAANRVYKNHVNDETKRSIAWVVVQFVEQTWKTIHGPEKLAKALETAEVLLRKKGIPFDAEEMMILIEAAVAEFNDAFKAPLLREDTEEATNDPGEMDQLVIPGFAG